MLSGRWLFSCCQQQLTDCHVVSVTSQLPLSWRDVIIPTSLCIILSALGHCCWQPVSLRCSRDKVAQTGEWAAKRHVRVPTRPLVNRFRSNSVQSLNTWHSKCCKSSRSRGQRSRSQPVIKCTKIRKIINNSAGIARFRPNFVQTLIMVGRLSTTSFQGDWLSKA